MAHQIRFGLLLLPLFIVGCPSTEDRFSEFQDRTKDERMSAGEEESGNPVDMLPAGLEDMSGVFLLAADTVVNPGSPLQFVTTIDMVLTDDGQSASATMAFQPLSLEVGSQTTPREFVGEVLTFDDVAFDVDGHFVVDMGVVMVTGAANPITGSDIVASLIIEGDIVHADAMCGGLDGDVMSPIQTGLYGSTFAMLRLEDDGSNPATLPTTFPWRCDMVQPLGGDGDGDSTDGDSTDGDTTTG